MSTNCTYFYEIELIQVRHTTHTHKSINRTKSVCHSYIQYNCKPTLTIYNLNCAQLKTEFFFILIVPSDLLKSIKLNKFQIKLITLDIFSLYYLTR